MIITSFFEGISKKNVRIVFLIDFQISLEYVFYMFDKDFIDCWLQKRRQKIVNRYKDEDFWYDTVHVSVHLRRHLSEKYKRQSFIIKRRFL